MTPGFQPRLSISQDRPCTIHPLIALSRGGVLEEVLGFEDVLEDTFWSPWPWPRSLKSLALALASKPQVLGLGLEALGPRKLPCPRLEDSTIFEPLKFCWKRQKPRGNIVNIFFFAQLERRLSQAGPLLPIEISSMTKMWQKSLLFLQF